MTQHKILIEGSEQAFLQASNDTLLQGALRAGIGFPYECSSGGCGSCKFELLEGEVENLWPEAAGLTERDRRKNRLLACQCRPKGTLKIKVNTSSEYKPHTLPRRRRARLVETQDITHDIREFHFITEEPADFQAGQYALLFIPGVAAPRAYSMSNTGNLKGEWHFQIRLVPGGKASESLFHNLKSGDGIDLDGPFGIAYLRKKSARDIVCVAGGSGLAPMISIARGASQDGMLKNRQLHFFYGARTPRDVCGEKILSELPELGGNMRYHSVVSQTEEGSQTSWSGETGFVHDMVRRVLGSEMPNYEFYFAGPPPMTQALQEMLMLEYRVPFEQVHFDRYF
jgi:toluene monooxygenase electron transfer component